jgi:hypothetical protein
MQTMIEHGINTALMIGVALIINAAIMINGALLIGVVLAIVRSTLVRANKLVVPAATGDTWHDAGAGGDDPGSVPAPVGVESFRMHPTAISSGEIAQ